MYPTSILSACASEAASTSLAATPVVTAEAPDNPNTILVDGSSTVGPITLKVAETFGHDHPEIEVPVSISGTGPARLIFLMPLAPSKPQKLKSASKMASNTSKYPLPLTDWR
jgi:ABC-type phosphate transport system substrate-binding protein